ncbi:MAG: histidine phosphatase family protein, partial [Acidimicrobiales bacterium]
RVSAAMDDLVHPGVDGSSGNKPGSAAGTTIVFTHGGPIRVAAAAALGISPPGHHRLAPPTNCSISSFGLVEGRWRLRHYNRPTVVESSTEPSE